LVLDDVLECDFLLVFDGERCWAKRRDFDGDGDEGDEGGKEREDDEGELCIIALLSSAVSVDFAAADLARFLPEDEDGLP
jgi:hypothetical protein